MQFELAHAVEILRRTPPTLHALLRHLPEPWARQNEGAGTWSPCDVLGHLIHGDETDWIPRARLILESGESAVFPPFDRFAQMNQAAPPALAELLDTFTALRARSLAELSAWNLTAGDLQKRGTHPAFGSVTLGQLLATWTVHDLSHLAQISRVLCRQYEEAVGPWKAYLPILQR